MNRTFGGFLEAADLRSWKATSENMSILMVRSELYIAIQLTLLTLSLTWPDWLWLGQTNLVFVFWIRDAASLRLVGWGWSAGSFQHRTEKISTDGGFNITNEVHDKITSLSNTLKNLNTADVYRLFLTLMINSKQIQIMWWDGVK